MAIGTVLLRLTRFGRQVYAVGSNPEAAAILGIRSRLVVFVAFSVCGLLAGVAGVMWVIEFGTINGTTATGAVLAIVAAVVVGGVAIFGGSGTLAGAAIGALFLGFIANALILVGLSQFWLQAIYGARHPRRRQRGRRPLPAAPARRRRSSEPDDRADRVRERAGQVDTPARALGDPARRSR